MFFLVATFLLILAMAAAAAWLVVKRGGELKTLVERGQPVTGQVVEKRARHSNVTAGRHRRVKIAYERPDTGPQQRWITVTRLEWDVFVEGAPVDLIYLPDNPSVFSTRVLVEQARKAVRR